MDKKSVEAEISAQSELVDSIPIDQALVTEIDRHIKDKEKQLNDRFVHICARVRIRHFLPPHPSSQTATEVDEKVWSSLRFAKSWPRRKNIYEEISFDKSPKGFSFFYTSGNVTYDMGVVDDFGGVDLYYRIIEDTRESVKLTGAPVEIKLWAFQYLKELLMEINGRANNIAKHV